MDDDEEVLLTLAEMLQTMVEFVGGPMYADDVMKPLEKLCSSEETTVREKVSRLHLQMLENRIDYLVFAVWSNLIAFNLIGNGKRQENFCSDPCQRFRDEHYGNAR